MNRINFIALFVIALTLCSCKDSIPEKTDKSATMFNYTLSWESQNQKYEHFTYLGNYAVIMNDVNVDDVEKALPNFASRDIFRQGCTATVKRNSKGEVIFGRNMDIDVSQSPAFLTTVKGGKYQTLIITYQGPNGCRYDQLDKLDKDSNALSDIIGAGTDAMNEAGLYIETNMREMDSEYNLYCSGINPGKTRAPMLSLPVLAAANCSTVDEVLEFINNSYDWYTPGFVMSGDSCIWNMAFLVGDAKGNYGLIESAGNKFYYMPYCPGQGNYYICPEIAEYAANGSGYGRLACALKGLPKCETEQNMMDNMKNCMYMEEILHPGCYGYSDYLINVNDRRHTSKEEMQKGFEAKMAPFHSAADAYSKGDEKELRDSGNVWTTSLNLGVNCTKRHLLLRLWEKDNLVIDVQWK